MNNEKIKELSNIIRDARKYSLIGEYGYSLEKYQEAVGIIKERQKEIINESEDLNEKWMKTKHAILFRLSNKIVQVSFLDQTEIILSSETKIVTYTDKKGQISTYPLNTALDSENYEMTKRLKYTKQILMHMLTAKSHSGGQQQAGNITSSTAKYSSNHQ